METRSITATFLAKNFSEILNQVRYQHVTLEVTRGHDLVAYVVPVHPPPRRLATSPHGGASGWTTPLVTALSRSAGPRDTITQSALPFFLNMLPR